MWESTTLSLRNSIGIVTACVMLFIGSGSAYGEADTESLAWDFIQDTGGVTIAGSPIRKIDYTFVKVKYDVTGGARIIKRPKKISDLKVTEIKWEDRSGDIVIHIMARQKQHTDPLRDTEHYFNTTTLPPGKYRVYYGNVRQDRYVGSFKMKAPNKSSAADAKRRAAD